MPLEISYSGTALIGAVERSLTLNAEGLAAVVASGVYQAVLDLSSLAAGDVFELRIYERVVAGGPQGVVLRRNLAGPVDEPVLVAAALQLMLGWDFTLRRIAGAASRSISWSIRRAG